MQSISDERAAYPPPTQLRARWQDEPHKRPSRRPTHAIGQAVSYAELGRVVQRASLLATRRQQQERIALRNERVRLIVGFAAILAFSGHGLLTALGVELWPGPRWVMPVALVALFVCMLGWPLARGSSDAGPVVKPSCD